MDNNKLSFTQKLCIALFGALMGYIIFTVFVEDRVQSTPTPGGSITIQGKPMADTVNPQKTIEERYDE